MFFRSRPIISDNISKVRKTAGWGDTSNCVARKGSLRWIYLIEILLFLTYSYMHARLMRKAMVLCVEVSERTKAELDELIHSGKYKDYSQVVAVAVANQLVLNARVSCEGDLMLTSRTKMGSSHPPEPIKLTTDVSASEQPAGEPTDHWAAPKIPSIFRRPAPTQVLDHFAPAPDDVFARDEAVSVDRWIFGQHNKLLPAKASCRALARFELQEWGEPKGLLLSKVASEIALEAAKLGDYLRTLDSRRGVHRDEAMSIAFPYNTGDTNDKARLRYASQFVGAMNRNHQLSGLLIDLKLINRVPSKQPRILLTQAGWKFASLPNPVLDTDASVSSLRFSDEETHFLLHHIEAAVPPEAFAYRAILSAFGSGENTPEKLDKVLAKLLPERTEKPFTREFLSTQRSGVISRMADLGLVERVRDGIKVTYRATPAGVSFLNGVDQNEGKEPIHE